MTAAGIEAENAELRQQVQELEAELAHFRAAPATPSPLLPSGATGKLSISGEESDAGDGKKELPLSLEEYKRYGRQMIMPEIGLEGVFLFEFC